MRRAVALALGAAAAHAVAPGHAGARPRYDVRVPERVELVAGAGGVLPLSLEVERGASISSAAAVTLDLQPDPAIGVKRRRLGRGDAVDPDAAAPRFAIPLRADTAGDFALRVRARFWLCGQKVCHPVEARRNVVIAVTAPVAPPSPAPLPAAP